MTPGSDNAGRTTWVSPFEQSKPTVKRRSDFTELAFQVEKRSEVTGERRRVLERGRSSRGGRTARAPNMCISLHKYFSARVFTSPANAQGHHTPPPKEDTPSEY